MKLPEAPKVIRQLDMSGYAEEWGEKLRVYVWLNISSGMYNDHMALMRRYLAAGERLRAVTDDTSQEERADLSAEIKDIAEKRIQFFAAVWSQGDPETHITVDDIRAILDAYDDSDPLLWEYMWSRSLEMIVGYRTGIKNVLRTPA